MNFLEHLPPVYKESDEVLNLQRAILSESSTLKDAVNDLMNQMFVRTATWGISYWEKYLGLSIDTEETIDNRRSRILTRLRGQGTVTIEMLKNVCRSFGNGEVDIIMNDDYSFTIKFIDTKGVPGNLEYLAESIRQIKPAHLNFNFIFLYNTWGTFKSDTYKNQKASTWGKIKVR